MAKFFSQAKSRFTDLKPKAELLVQIPVTEINPEPGAEYFLNLRVSRSDAWNYVPEDHVYATAQFKLPVEGKPVLAQNDNHGCPSDKNR